MEISNLIMESKHASLDVRWMSLDVAGCPILLPTYQPTHHYVTIPMADMFH
jgi:hypothetical protein